MMWNRGFSHERLLNSHTKDIFWRERGGGGGGKREKGRERGEREREEREKEREGERTDVSKRERIEM